MVPHATPTCRESHLGVVASLPLSSAPAYEPKPGFGPGETRLDAQAGEDALSRLAGLLYRDLEACNRAIVARMDSPVALIPQLAAHIVAAGGKRIRPLLTPAAARPRQRQRGIRQQGFRPGRGFPVRPLLPAHGG